MINEVFRILGPLAVLAAGTAGFVLFGQKAEPQQKPLAESNALEVQTVPVRLFDGEDDKIEIEFEGLVVPFRQISVSAEIAGRVTYKSEDLRAGKYVEAGTELIRIDPEFYELEVERLTAEKAQIDSASDELQTQITSTGKLIEIAEKQLQIEADELARLEKLKERGVASESELTPLRRNKLNAENTLAMLEKEKSQFQKKLEQNQHTAQITQAKLGQAIRDQGQSILKAPISGLVVDDPVEEGSFVQRGTELFLLEDTSQVEISSNLTMDELGWLLQSTQHSSQGTLPDNDQAAYELPHADVTVIYNLAGEIYHWNGHISRLAGTGMDPRSRTIPCRVTVPEPRRFQVGADSKLKTSRSPRTLMNGMFVQMKTGVVPSRPLLALPEAAVRPGNLVWKSTPKGLQVVKVDVLHRQGQEVLILKDNSPLAAGDELITSQLAEAKSGTSIRKETETASSGAAPAGTVR